MTARFLLVICCAGSIALGAAQQVAYDPARAAAMHDDLRAVGVVQAAVIRGDVDAARTAARRLAAVGIPPGLPDTARQHVDAMRRAAGETAAAPDVAAAATGTGRMLAACGDCHRAMGTAPAIGTVGVPSVGGAVGHMLEHQQAANQLLRALVIPSDQEWRLGARRLRAAPLGARDLPTAGDIRRERLRIEEAVHRLAEEAVAAETPDTRVRVLGTLLARCADCHGAHPRIWGPGAE